MSLNSLNTGLVDTFKSSLCKKIYWNSCSMTQNLTNSDHFSFFVPLQSSNYRESTDETQNLCVRLCGTITTSQLFCEQSSFNLSLSWPLKVSITISEYCSVGYLFSFLTLSRYGEMISSKNSTDLSVFDQWFSVKVTEKELGN